MYFNGSIFCNQNADPESQTLTQGHESTQFSQALPPCPGSSSGSHAGSCLASCCHISLELSHLGSSSPFPCTLWPWHFQKSWPDCGMHLQADLTDVFSRLNWGRIFFGKNTKGVGCVPFSTYHIQDIMSMSHSPGQFNVFTCLKWFLPCFFTIKALFFSSSLVSVLRGPALSLCTGPASHQPCLHYLWCALIVLACDTHNEDFLFL